jgi:hypothetical protein
MILRELELTSTLKMEAEYSSKTFVFIYLTARKRTELSRVSVTIDGVWIGECVY